MTCTPAMYDEGRHNTHRPEAPNLVSEARALATTASRESTTCLGSPVEPEDSMTKGAGSSAASHSRNWVTAVTGASEGCKKLT